MCGSQSGFDGDLDCVIHHDDELYCIQDECPLNCFCNGLNIYCSLPTKNSTQRLVLKSFKSVTVHTTTKSFPQFESCFRCLTLNLSGSIIHILKQNDLIQLYNLAVLNLSESSISVIEAKSFQSMNNLRILDLTKNTLRVISSQSFQGLSSLTHVQMSYTKIHDLPLFPQSKLLKIFNVSHSTLYKLDMSYIMSEFTILDIKSTDSLCLLTSMLNQANNVTVLTNLPIICCMLHESVECNA